MYMWKVFVSPNKEVAVAIVAAVVTILISVFSVIAAKYYERRTSVELEIRGQKIPIYEEFINFIFKIWFQEKLTGKKLTEKEMIKFLNAFTQKLILWGSDEVLKKWSKFRVKLINEKFAQAEPHELLFDIEEILLAIRIDTGHKNKNLSRGDILGLFINDLETHLPESSKP